MSDTPATYRQHLAVTIAAALREDDLVRAVGEGGAVARGRADDYSDLDLVVVAPLTHADTIFARVETAITTVARVSHERHGEAVVWFDRDGVLQPRDVDAVAAATRRNHQLAQLRGSTPVYVMLVAKELARGHTLEAYGFYQTLLRTLIELLGMRHRPDRFDFGWRYVDRELPASAQALIASHTFVAGTSALPGLLASLEREIDGLLVMLAATNEPGPSISAAAPGGRPSP
jgi:predicted nucleotidyltransferase